MYKVKTQQVGRSRGQRYGDIELVAYLANAEGPVPLDLRIIALIIIIVPLTLCPLCLLFPVHLGAYTANFGTFYFYKLIGKLTAFLQLQECGLH
jgi:hypothetical protein